MCEMECPFCKPNLNMGTVIQENALCLFLQEPQPVLVGSGMIIPRAHRETVFDLTAEEWQATFDLLRQAKALLDGQYHPDGYNIGWNCGQVGGQEVFHAHLHVIPRFRDEPLAGKGIRYWLKQGPKRGTA
jgi:diadenosine tetraphosphate (Ap4A) HIT family hydrolase